MINCLLNTTDSSHSQLVLDLVVFIVFAVNSLLLHCKCVEKFSNMFLILLVLFLCKLFFWCFIDLHVFL